jgi:pantoate--beta-alanine ligase
MHQMQVLRTVAQLRETLAARRDVVLVPTMGNLHEGHLSLLELAQGRGGFVVASIFVNRLQFAPHEDFDQYPRTLARDCELLANAGCDMVFAPAEQELYPQPQTYKVIPAAPLAGLLEGAVRPGFFTGVCTVVLKLFNLIQPAAAVFGKKDYQQLLVIQNMVRQLALPIDIIAAEIVRNSDGLALSSRNAYLGEDQRIEAKQLNAMLRTLAQDVRLGSRDWGALEHRAMAFLTERGWRPDYVAVRTRMDLSAPAVGEALVALAAATLGRTRLIDNLEI